jgi:integrase
MRQGVADVNPVLGTSKPADERPRDRVLTDEELVTIWHVCRDDDYGRILRLLILTGQRRVEVGDARRSEIDFDARRWRLPASRTKNGQPHEVPLSDAAASLFRSAGRDGRDLLFGRDEAAGYGGWSAAKRALDKRISDGGSKLESWHLHDIRRTVATRMAELGVMPHVVEAVLNHISGHKAGVAGVYNRALYAAEKRQALNRWAEHVTALVSGRASNVVALRPSSTASN